MMHSQIEFSQYAELEEPRKEEFIFDFSVNEYDRDISRNLEPRLQLTWAIPNPNSGKFIVDKHRISRVKTSMLDDTHKMAPLSTGLPSSSPLTLP